MSVQIGQKIWLHFDDGSVEAEAYLFFDFEGDMTENFAEADTIIMRHLDDPTQCNVLSADDLRQAGQITKN